MDGAPSRHSFQVLSGSEILQSEKKMNSVPNLNKNEFCSCILCMLPHYLN